MSNEPKVLVEFTPEEITWLADRLHECWANSVSAGAIATGSKEQEVQDYKKRAIELLNRIQDKAHDQGFGCL